MFIDQYVYRYDYYNNNNVSRKEFWSVDGGGGMLRAAELLYAHRLGESRGKFS